MGFRSKPPIKKHTPACEIKELCGSCEYVNTKYADSLKLKYDSALKLFDDEQLLEGVHSLPVKASPKALGYRCVAKLAIRPLESGEDRFAMGLFQPGSHNVININSCPLHTPAIKRMLKDLHDELEESELDPWNEATGKGDVRYIAIRSSHQTKELMCTFVVTRKCDRELREIIQNLRLKDHRLVSNHMNINSGPGNQIFGETTKKISGSHRLREGLCDLSLEISPTAFFQVNPWQAEQLYRRVEQIAGHASKPLKAWDLYCGGGYLAMILARLGYQVQAMEENPQAIEDAENNAAKNGLTDSIQFHTGRVEEKISDLIFRGESPQLVVVNPSRRGLAEPARAVLSHLLAVNPNVRLIYVSCEASTLVRDLKELTSGPGQLRQVEAFDMFPQTGKLEWLAVVD